MSPNINYHLTMTTEKNSVIDVDLVSSKCKTESSVTIGGRNYSLTGSENACSRIRDIINQTKTTTFKDIKEFKTVILKNDKASEKINDIGVEFLLTPVQKFKRAVKNAAQIGHGMSKMRGEGIRGRTVMSEYYREVTNAGKDNSPLAREKRFLWEDSKESKLSFPEWEKKMTTEWKESKSEYGFVEWTRRELWKNSGSKDTFQDFSLKTLQKIIGNKEPFEKFKKNDLNWKKGVWKKEAPHLSFEKFDQLMELKMNEGSTLSFANWEKLQDWKSKGSQGDFATWALEQDYQKDVNKGSKLSFNEWKDKGEEDLKKRWEGSGLKNAGVSFSDWRLLQDDSSLIESQPFIRLDEKQRGLFKTSFLNGNMQRNGIPYDTSHEKTLHSGAGYAIFVISPQGDLYSGSHIGNVFHHSSFLADGAVASAGEIATNSKGEITYLSSKSGHYRPTDEESRLMLKMFQENGVDLSKVSFSSYVGGGTLKLKNAKTFLEHLEKIREQREKSQVKVIGGKLKKEEQEFSETKVPVVLNNMGQIYCGPHLSDSFKMEEKTGSLQLKPKTQILEEKEILKEIKVIKNKLETLSLDTQKEEELVKKTTKKNRTRKPSRKLSIERNRKTIEKYRKKLTSLQDNLNDIRGLGKDTVSGGGNMTFDKDGKIIRIDAKLSNKPLRKEEIRFTLRHLKSQGVELNKVELITYTNDGKREARKIDSEYYKELMVI